MKKILVLANDAGGAEILSAMVWAEQGNYCWTVVVPTGSPASRIFQRDCTNIRILVEDYQDLSAEFLCSFESDLVVYNPGRHSFPREAARELRQRGVTTFAVLDHWINFRERFGFPSPQWQDGLPNFVATCDSAAYEIALREGLQNVVRLRHYRIIEQLARYRQLEGLQTTRPDSLLFLSQSVGTPPGNSGAFKDFGSAEGAVIGEIGRNFGALTNHFGVQDLVVRLHPAEGEYRFSAELACYPQIRYRVERADERDILESICNARVVVGMNSMALFVAFACGRPSVSIMPDSDTRCTLPLPSEVCISRVEQMLDLNLSSITNLQQGVDFFSTRGFSQFAEITQAGDA